LPPIGTKLKAKSKDKSYEAVVTKSSNNPNRRAVYFKKIEYLSLSGAAKAITGHATNGWVFWKFGAH